MSRDVNFGAIMEALNNKVDIDGNWGVPDYSNGVEIQNGEYNSGSYTAPTRGELHLYMIPATGSTTFKVNNIPVGAQKPTTTGSYASFNYAIIGQGDVVSWSSSTTCIVQAYFYPLKAIN